MSKIISTTSRRITQALGPNGSAGVWAGVVVLLAVACLYLFTLDNGLRPDELSGGDLITHQYAQVEARPSNAPGYPLYTIGGWVWFRVGRALLSWGLNPIQILSLYSTIWALASLLILYLILLQISQRWLVAGLLTAFYAVTYFFWYYSVTTEQYTSAVFQTLLMIWLAFRWQEQPRDKLLLGLAGLIGTMLANMVTTLLILPPLLWFILFQPGPSTGLKPAAYLYSLLKKPKVIWLAIGLALAPLASYVYVFIRGALHPEWRGVGAWSGSWEWFIQFLTIQQGRDELAPGLSWQNFFTAEFPALLWQELTWPVFVGGLIGLAFLGQRRAIFLYSTLALYLIFCWLYRFGNWFQVIIPAYPIFIIGVAAGLRRVSEWRMSEYSIGQSQRPPMGRSANQQRITNDQYRKGTMLPMINYQLPITLLITALLITLLLFRFTTNLPRATQHNRPDDTGLNPGWAILADQPRPPALISADFAERVALQYLQMVWGEGRQLNLTAGPGDFTAPSAPAESSYYLTRQAVLAVPAALSSPKNWPFVELHPQAAGEQLILLMGQPLLDLPPPAQALGLAFGQPLTLVGWQSAQTNPAKWQIALYWQANQLLTEDYTISVRPLVEGQPIKLDGVAQIQDHQPVWGLYPTSRWRPGELVRDVYALDLPAEVRPEAVQVVVYKTVAGGFENIGEQTIVVR
jgi:hypothetical protein